jgi:hypothetical protein
MSQGRYLEYENAWLLPSPDGESCEVLVAGDSAGPNAKRLALSEAAIRLLPELRERAAAYLDEFVDCMKFATTSKWHLEGFSCGSAGETEDQFSLGFSREDDTYGKWSVTFQLSSGRYFPVAFARHSI